MTGSQSAGAGNLERARAAGQVLRSALATVESWLVSQAAVDPSPDHDEMLEMAAVVEAARTLRRAADDLAVRLGAEALERGVSPSVLDWADGDT